MAEIVRIEGLEAVRRALMETPVHLRKKVITRILRKAAQPIVRAAKANAPVAKKSSKRVIPGLIRKTIGVAASRIHNGRNGVFGVYIQPLKPAGVKRISRAARKAGAKGPNFGDPFYYKFQEAGFHAVGRKRIGGGRRARSERVKHSGARFIPGKAFMGRAFESQKHKAVELIRADLVTETIAAFNKRVKK